MRATGFDEERRELAAFEVCFRAFDVCFADGAAEAVTSPAGFSFEWREGETRTFSIVVSFRSPGVSCPRRLGLDRGSTRDVAGFRRRTVGPRRWSTARRAAGRGGDCRLRLGLGARRVVAGFGLWASGMDRGSTTGLAVGREGGRGAATRFWSV